MATLSAAWLSLAAILAQPLAAANTASHASVAAAASATGVSPMFRISRDGQAPTIDLDDIDQLEPAIRSRPLGRYRVDEIGA